MCLRDVSEEARFDPSRSFNPRTLAPSAASITLGSNQRKRLRARPASSFASSFDTGPPEVRVFLYLQLRASRYSILLTANRRNRTRAWAHQPIAPSSAHQKPCRRGIAFSVREHAGRTFFKFTTRVAIKNFLSRAQISDLELSEINDLYADLSQMPVERGDDERQACPANECDGAKMDDPAAHPSHKSKSLPSNTISVPFDAGSHPWSVGSNATRSKNRCLVLRRPMLCFVAELSLVTTRRPRVKCNANTASLMSLPGCPTNLQFQLYYWRGWPLTIEKPTRGSVELVSKMHSGL